MSRRKATSDLWWKNAVVYCLDVETFQDSDGDGCGDLPRAHRPHRLPRRHRRDVPVAHADLPVAGARRRLRHRRLLRRRPAAGDARRRRRARPHRERPRHPRDPRPRRQPHLDRPSVVPERAQLAGLAVPRLLRLARREARGEAGRRRLPRPGGSNWAYDRKAHQWYLHRFYSEQPDLNVANPQVRDEIAQIAGFWLQQGMAGFRVDAVPFLLEPTGMPEGAIADPHELLRDLRAYLGRRRGDVVLLGEVNLPPDQQRDFFGVDGRTQLDLVFNFHAMQAMYLALAREDAAPLARAMKRLPELPMERQWATFARNHDELTLDQLSEEQRQEVFAAFGPSKDLQLYGRGLRRRLPTMVEGDQRRMRLVYSLMFSLPGTPVLFYGEEIGMGENLDIEGRLAVRSPMQWSDERQRRLLDRRRRGRPVPAGHGDQGLRTAGRERRGPAPRPRLAAQLVRAAHAPAQGAARARLGRVRAARRRSARGVRARGDVGRRDRRRGPQLRGPRRAPPPSRSATTAEQLVDLFGGDHRPCREGPRRARPRAVRPPLVPRPLMDDLPRADARPRPRRAGRRRRRSSASSTASSGSARDRREGRADARAVRRAPRRHDRLDPRRPTARSTSAASPARTATTTRRRRARSASTTCGPATGATADDVPTRRSSPRSPAEAATSSASTSRGQTYHRSFARMSDW